MVHPISIIRKALSLAFFLVISSISLNAQLFTYGHQDTFTVRGVAADDLGFVYSAGQNFSGNGFVAKYTPTGTPVWTFIDGAGGTYGVNLKWARVTSSGEVLAGGSIGSGAVLGGVTATTSGNQDPLLLKLDAQGNLLWWEKFGGGTSSFEDMFDAYEHPNGDITCLGYANGAVILGGNSIPISGARPFWATFDAFGTYISGGVAALTTGACWNGTIDSQGNMYATSFNSPDQTLSKYNPAGVLQWTITGNGTGEWFDIAVDASGNVFAGGSFDGTFNMGGSTYTSQTMYDDLFLFKADANGTLLWTKQFGSTQADNIYDLEVDGNGDVFLAGLMGASCTFDAITAPSIGSSDVFLAKLASSNGAVSWATAGGSTVTDAEMGLAVNPVSGQIVLGVIGSPTNQNTYGPISLLCPNSLWLTVLDHACTARGTLFRDLDGNGVQGAGENGFANRSVQMTPGPLYGFSGPAGGYEIYSDIGSYSISIPSLPLYHNLSGASSHTASYSALGQFDLGNDFALQPVPNMNDLKVNLTATNYGLRQGRSEGYQITYENIGTTTISNASISFKHPAGSSFSYAVPAATNIVGASDSVQWNVGTLAPGQSGFIFVLVSMPTYYPLGSMATLRAYVSPLAGDQTPGDNQSTFNHLVVGPYDPNIKQVFPAGDISPQFVASNEFLEYTIHFQNTGNDTAYFVRLEDTISANLDLATFEFIAGSHAQTWSINNDRKLKVDFLQIMLPDSFVNEPASHGFFKYRAKPLSSLQLGDDIRNTAHIYFDYQAPITTNTTITVVAEPTATEEASNPLEGLNLFPNPAGSELNIVWIDARNNLPVQATVLDVHGRVVGSVAPFRTGTTLDLSSYPSGMYLLRAEREGKVLGTTRFVKR